MNALGKEIKSFAVGDLTGNHFLPREHAGELLEEADVEVSFPLATDHSCAHEMFLGVVSDALRGHDNRVLWPDDSNLGTK